MKSSQFYLLVAVSAVCLILSLVNLSLGQTGERLEKQVRQQQEEINQGNMAEQIGTNILRDLAPLSQQDAKIKDLLSRNGFTIKVNSGSAPQ